MADQNAIVQFLVALNFCTSCGYLPVDTHKVPQTRRPACPSRGKQPNQFPRRTALYGRYIDKKQWDKLSSIALPDAELRFSDPDGSLTPSAGHPWPSRRQNNAHPFSTSFLDTAQTLHMFGTGELEQIQADEVRAIWPIEDHFILRQGLLPVEIRGGGYYYEIWRQKDDGWFLESLGLRRTYTKPSLLARLGGLLSWYFRPKHCAVFDTKDRMLQHA